MYEGPPATPEAQEAFYDNGLRVLSQFAATLAVDPQITARAQQASLPQLDAIIEAVSGATWEPVDEQTDMFEFADGTRRRLRELVTQAS